MKSRLHLSLSLSLLWLALPQARAQTADDIFHDGAVNYLSNNIPKALEVVTNGRAIFPDDIKLKKLEELLKQQNQQQQQQQQKQDEKKDQQKQDQQSKQDQKDQSKDQKDKQDQQQAQSQPKPEDKEKDEKARQMQAHAMTPQEAKQLLDAQKGDEQVLVFKPPEERKNRDKVLKDW